MAYNVRIYHYADGKQVRTYSKTVYHGRTRDGPKELDYDPTYYWESDVGDGWEHYEPDPVKQKEKNVRSSMNRTKQQIYGVARANNWEYFLTLTFDRNKTDSSDFDLVMKRCKKWLNNLKQRYCKNLQYLIVPELHADKEHWHLHGLLGCCEGLKLADSGHKDNEGRVIWNLQNWRYGFSTVTEVGEQERVSHYITKYITKDLCEVSMNKHRYLVSSNCLRTGNVCEELLLDENDVGTFLDLIKDKITYAKSQNIPAAYQRVNYFELTLT